MWVLRAINEGPHIYYLRQMIFALKRVRLLLFIQALPSAADHNTVCIASTTGQLDSQRAMKLIFTRFDKDTYTEKHKRR